ncbi:MAG: hypothetical protein KDA68_08365 [Planctomycetaceae bacterium]|nr:hypothetical protein [Planctomycetaceae bacterium]
MATDAATIDTQASPPEAAHSDNEPKIKVSCEQLIVGRCLDHPLYDGNGVLLLAQGALITSELRKNLKSRNISEVEVSKSDAVKLSLTTDQLAELFTRQGAFSFDTETTTKLDTIIDSGLMAVKNDGPALKESVVFHGRKAYSAEKRESLLLQHQSASESLDTMIKGVLKGGRVDGAGIAVMTANFLSGLTSDTDSLMSVAFEARSDAALADDSLKTSMYGMAIALEMGLDAENIRKIGLIGIVQNWGMVRVPKAIRYCERSLTDKEFLEIKRHPIYTLEMLEKISGFSAVVPLVAYQMHEQINGRGYPRGRSGKSIHQYARILQVADAYVAMTSPRPYRQPLMPYVAMSSLLGYTKIRKFDPEVVRAFLLTMALFPIGSVVVLEDSRVAVVYRRNGNNYNQPIVKILQNPDGTLADPNDPAAIVDLAEAGIQVVQALPTPGRNELTADTRPAPTCT